MIANGMGSGCADVVVPRGAVRVEHDLVPVLAREHDEDGEEGVADVVKVVARRPLVVRPR